MPKAKNFANIILVLFVLFSIPLTIQVAQRSNLASRAAGLDLSVAVTPNSGEIASGGSLVFQLELNVPSQNIKNKIPVLLQFNGLPEGVSLNPRPLGATPSNYFQKIHSFNVVVDSITKAGKYNIEVIASDLKRQQKTVFSIVVK